MHTHRKNKKTYKEKDKWSRSDKFTLANILVSCAGVLATCAVIAFGLHETNKTISNSFIEIQKTNIIEQTSALPIKLFEFSRNASLAFATLANSTDSNISEDERKEFRDDFEKYDAIQSSLLNEIQPLILSYGSKESINIFNDFFLSLRALVNKDTENGTAHIKEWLPIYAQLPLLMSVVKYDVTGDIINPSVMFDLYMPEFSNKVDEFYTQTNQIIKKYDLDEEFMWPEPLPTSE